MKNQEIWLFALIVLIEFGYYTFIAYNYFKSTESLSSTKKLRIDGVKEVMVLRICCVSLLVLNTLALLNIPIAFSILRVDIIINDI